MYEYIHIFAIIMLDCDINVTVLFILFVEISAEINHSELLQSI